MSGKIITAFFGTQDYMLRTLSENGCSNGYGSIHPVGTDLPSYRDMNGEQKKNYIDQKWGEYNAALKFNDIEFAAKCLDEIIDSLNEDKEDSE